MQEMVYGPKTVISDSCEESSELVDEVSDRYSQLLPPKMPTSSKRSLTSGSLKYLSDRFNKENKSDQHSENDSLLGHATHLCQLVQQQRKDMRSKDEMLKSKEATIASLQD